MSSASYSVDTQVRIMDSSAPRQRAETVLEYALYVAILTMTVAGAFVYQAIVQDPWLSSFILYLILAYLVFLALAFGQLNRLHRKRARSTPKPEAETLTYAVQWSPSAESEGVLGRDRRRSGMVLEQTRDRF
jgi:hypothetical protein